MDLWWLICCLWLQRLLRAVTAVAVVLDNLVFSAPNVQTAITNGRSQISFGSGQSAEDKLAEAEDLAYDGEVDQQGSRQHHREGRQALSQGR